MKQLCFTLLVLAVASGLYAQTTGQITGTVRDNTGAIVPGAEVTVTNTAQGTPSKTTTNNAGDYLIAGLGEGTYNIEISAKGFKKRVVNGIVLRVAEKARADATLDVGEVTTEVTVAGEGIAQVETQSAEISGTVTGRQITQMPLNNRNFTQLITLVPGVSNQTGQDEPGVGVYGSEAYSVNGGRTEYNNWEVDGGDMMDNGSNGTINVYPSVDAIGEVKVLTSNYGAQYGRNSSGTIESVIKSGGKDFHGDVYEFVRNDDFNARNFFQGTRPEYRKNDWGYTIGGPVFIPHLLPKNDKTFFFFSEEWRRNLVPGQTFNSQEPSAQERTGNFSDVCPGADCPVNPVTKQPFPGNIVPIDPAAQIMMNAMIPAPNAGSGNQSFYNAAPATLEKFREELVRVDHNFTDNWRVFAHYIHDSWSTVVPNALWGNGTSFPTVNTTFVGPGTSTVFHLANNASPTLLNEFTWSYTADHIFLNAIGPAAAPPPANFPMGSLYNNGFGGLLPALSIQGNSSYGGGFSADSGYFPWNNANPTYTIRDQVTKISGNHNMYFGFYMVLAEKNEENSPYLQGVLNFSATDTAVSTGNAFADFMLGRIASYQQANSKIKYYNRYKIVEPYFQDDWHITRKLTLNLGLRVSGFGTYREKYMRAYNWEPGAYSAASAPQIDISGSITGQPGALVPGVGNPFDGQVQCGANGLPAGCLKGHLFNPAPRVGFAYDPFGNGRWAIRGGYGVFFEHTNGNEGNTESLEGTAPLVQSSTQYNIIGYTNIGAGGLAFPLNTTAIPTKAVWPYVQQWNLGMQHEFWKHIVGDIAYVGSKGTHLTLESNYNQMFPTPLSANPFGPGQPITSGNCSSLSVNGTAVTGQALNNLNIACGNGIGPNPYRPYLGFGNITQLVDMANSVYNAMQISIRRTMGRLQWSVAYTWSHSIDDSSDRYDGNFVNSYNFAANRASSTFDQRHLLNISHNYDLPFFSQPGLAHKILGGWQLNGITSFQTGTPFTVTNGVFGDNAGVGNGVGTGSYPGVAGNPNSAAPIVNAAGITGPLLFNPGAFVAPTGLTFGNSGRDFLNNPSRINFDMGLFKRFAITESRLFEFRAEAFNIFNHTQWNGIHSSITCYGGANNSAGDASCLDNSFLHPSGAHNPRILQLGAKFIF